MNDSSTTLESSLKADLKLDFYGVILSVLLFMVCHAWQDVYDTCVDVHDMPCMR